MPREVVNRINAAVGQILRQKDFSEALAATGSLTMQMTAEQLQAHIAAEITKYIGIARDAKLEPQ